MAVHIKLIKNNIKSSSSYGKYFAKAVSQGEVTLEDIAAEACRNSGFSEGSVVGVVTELQDILKQRLREGQTVVLPGIGRFSLRVESIGVDDPKAFNIRSHITRIVCGFLPAGRRIQGRHILYDLCDGSKPSGRKTPNAELDTVLQRIREALSTVPAASSLSGWLYIPL